LQTGMTVASHQTFLPLKTPAEIDQLQRAGSVNWRAHRLAESMLVPGASPIAIDAAIEEFFSRCGAEPLFRGVIGPNGTPYPSVSCISVNDGVVHGIPHTWPLLSGDVVTIDLGCRLDGWCADSAETHIVGRGTSENRNLVELTRGLLDLAIRLIPQSERWSDVVRHLDRFLERTRLTQIAPVFGHGIGRELHEAPQVALTLQSPLVHFADFDLEPGLVFTIEPVLTTGNGTLRLGDDQWTLITNDGCPAAHFEHTIALVEGAVRVLTTGG
jgi:methionyl aminopeptidase